MVCVLVVAAIYQMMMMIMMEVIGCMVRKKRGGRHCKILSGQFSRSVNCTALPVRCWSPNPGLARMTTYIQHHCTKH